MLAVAGGKGGCGKTTTTLGLALAAARDGRAVLAVDADVDVPDLHRVAGAAEPVGTATDATGAGPTPGHPAPRTVPDAPAVDVLPARPGTDPDALADRLAGHREPRDLVLLDCPAGAGPDAAVPMRAADRTLVVTTPDEPSLRDAAKTAAMSRAVGTPVAAAVATRVDHPPDRLGRLFDAGVVEAVPRTANPLQAAVAKRRFTRILRRLPAV